MVDTILHNGRFTTLDPETPDATAVAIAAGRITQVGHDRDIMPLAQDDTDVIDLGGRRVIPGLNDSHTHLIRGGLYYNMELRWENVPSVSDALAMLKRQAANTPAPQWVRVVGGWSEFQFAERRMPTLEEINHAAPDTPVFILHLYGSAMLNRAALRVLGITKETKDPPGGVIERDARGHPTGMLIAKPSALILYSTLAKGPSLSPEDQRNSTLHFMRELNRLGVTSVIDAGGGGQNYPDDYDVVSDLNAEGKLTLRIAYNLFAQTPGAELSDYERWTQMTEPGAGDAMLRMNGAGENLTWSAADFENFLEPRPDLAPTMEADLEKIVSLLAENEWPFRIHATYDETIDRFLSVFERVNGHTPFKTRFIIDHAETITPRNIERIKALGGGIASQHRMAFQGEYFIDRYGAEQTKQTPPLRSILDTGTPLGGGTDATRVASYDPWVAIKWLCTGQTVGGTPLYDDGNLLSREEAVAIWTTGSAWFSGEQDRKGRIAPDMYADLAVLSDDLMSVQDDAIRRITSVLTLVNGAVVWADAEFAPRCPPMPPVSPEWGPPAHFASPAERQPALSPALAGMRACADGCASGCGLHGHNHQIAWANPLPVHDRKSFWGALGCSCFMA
ncbi:amidohydrolase [Sulfitobacter sp. S190]|uniref:amidohydrolase n=1 Tax=Sulfitobacter sp. S190 TaxID=2867022 RepID=UPI0021A87E0A|nr:amidohydrolase [Sulfitobacter sp. S190]UWR24529.1 amidohydrolase [Sulfitobacter sp. S190]